MYSKPTVRRLGSMAELTLQVGQPNGSDQFLADGVPFGGNGGFSADVCTVNGQLVDC